jgi:galactokinase
MNKEVTSEGFKPELIIAAPGRINLIGEHTDYNMGFVFPAAIDRRIEFGIRRNGSEQECNVYSVDFDKLLSFNLKEVEPSQEEWENYILGVVFEIQKLGHLLHGFDCQLQSNLPIGAGISSSAAMECGLAFALNSLFDLGLSKMDIILLSQRAEHNYVGTQCGIMDQYASVMGQPNQAILLDCRNVTHQMIPLHLEPYTLLLLNTNVSHNLASSEYNLRRSECEQGVQILKKSGLKIDSLRDVSEGDLIENKHAMSSTIFKRCLYVVTENQRVRHAASALKKNHLEEFGKLMYQSHAGLKNEYEVSCPELDFLVDYAQNSPHVIGCRMMGGGFGGCTINLILNEYVDSYVEEVKKAYNQEFGIELDPIQVNPSRGTFAMS